MARRILIIGAGEAGEMVVKEIRAHPDSGLEPVGFLDDDPAKRNKRLEGLPVLGTTEELASVTKKIGVDEVLIAVPSAGRDFVRKAIARCRDAAVPFKIVPGLIEIIKGPVHLEQIREVHPDDLLGREMVEFDERAITREISGKRVMITGAGGSIGGEIARQIGRFRPSRVLLLGRGENQVFDIEQELGELYPSLELEPIIADIRDRERLMELFERYRPHYVYHAAAHKHVHYMEAFPEEAVMNNVFGTVNVLDAAKMAGVEKLVMMSTDKAVNPRGVMGATKRLAEYIVRASSDAESGFKAISVRFGNVLGSRGSVVPLFIRQIRKQKTVTVTHPEATRYFMTLREACMLVIQASIMGSGGEIFILRMGSPIKITEIARDLIALHGLRPEVDVKISIVGLRPGEKLHEELVAEDESVEESPQEYIFVCRPHNEPGPRLAEGLERLRECAEKREGHGMRRILEELISDAELF